MGRLTDNDRRFGPLTWGECGKHWRPWRAVWSSGGGDERDARNSLTVYAFGWIVRLWLPSILRPWKQWVDTSRYAWSKGPGAGYWEVEPREFGFSLSEGFLQLFLGPQTDDSTTTKSWCCHLPWTQWRHVRFTLYDLDGNEFWTQRDADPVKVGEYPWQHRQEAEALAPKAVFEFDDFDGKRISATTHIEEREWRLGTGWFKWLALFAKPRIRRSLDIKFSEEVGPEKGSWKGGTTGHGIDMLAHEDAEAAFRRYCEQEQRAKNATYRITYVGRKVNEAAVAT